MLGFILVVFFHLLQRFVRRSENDGSCSYTLVFTVFSNQYQKQRALPLDSWALVTDASFEMSEHYRQWSLDLELTPCLCPVDNPAERKVSSLQNHGYHS